MRALAARGYQAIAVDPPGTGHSDRPAAATTPARLPALHQTMLALGHASYDVVGHDIGMWVVMRWPATIRAWWPLALTEAVIPGLAPAPPIFVAPEDNIFLWHFMFNQVPTCPRR
jgi:pimeloyl-ACP methyl ester carboxylesterase